VSTETPPAATGPNVSSKLQILATEHWSILATRALTYNESLSRVNIFLAVLSGGVIALALVAQADHFGMAFISIAIPVLFIVLFTGVATIARLTRLNQDDYRWVIAMNRLRHGYLQLHPDLEPNFTTSQYDDLRGGLLTLGIDDPGAGRSLSSVLHIPQTLPGMLTVIVAAVGGAITALVALAFGIPSAGVAVAAAAGFVLVLVLMTVSERGAYARTPPSLQPRFPAPDA
jgi:hypothetical protein